jgi:dCMP deaminase
LETYLHQKRLESNLKPDWNTYFITLCFLVAQRSPDPRTKHGSVIVDKQNRIISTGYNGSPKGIEDWQIDWGTNEKYKYVCHSELNAILVAKQDLTDCTLYVTGPCCGDCAKKIIQSGIKKVVYSGVQSNMVDKDAADFVVKLFNMADVEYTHYPNHDSISKLLDDAADYCELKLFTPKIV